MRPELPAEVMEIYEVVRPIGVGGQGRTYLARSPDDELVVLKALDFVELTSFKELDLFQREVKVLRSLDHPAIPKLLGHYPKSLEDEPEQVVIVQEYIEGDTLEEVSKAEDGPIFDEPQAREFLREMLELLDYLHGLNPPVVHRDIKPSNIIRRPNGSHALIDFGAARATGVVTDGSTFIGTNGYMAPNS